VSHIDHNRTEPSQLYEKSRGAGSDSIFIGWSTPLEEITGETHDISEYLDFSFYDWVWYKDNAGVGDNSCGQWLGVSHRIGSLMSYWILPKSGKVISRTTVQRMTSSEMETTEVKDRMRVFYRQS
jgi:hypothetical protein